MFCFGIFSPYILIQYSISANTFSPSLSALTYKPSFFSSYIFWFLFEKEELSGFCSKKRKEFVHNDKFPIGIRVLAVEDDLTRLWLLDTIS